LFITCWLIFVLHFATDFVREHYLVLSIVDDFSFRLDKYAGLHPDIFETPNHGVHHGANPGASMIAAIPYMVFKPIVNGVSHYTKRGNQPGKDGPAIYKDHRPARERFYKQVRERGLDIKFGLVGIITMVFCMAPLSSLGALVMFQALGRVGLSSRASIWLALLYAFGTPIFFRTAYLNQNLMVAVFTFMAFLQLWQAKEKKQTSFRWRFATAGFLGGLSLLCDYSALVPLVLLYGYGVLRRTDLTTLRQALKESLFYPLGMIGPVLLLWFYQWQSFGFPFYPPQHSMPPLALTDFVGYRGFVWPKGELGWMLLFDYRFGLFLISPILLLAFVAPLLNHFKKSIVPLRETLFIFFLFFSFTLFFSCIEHTRLQWVSGIRYMVPMIPFLYLLTAAVIIRIPKKVAYGLAVFSFAASWCMSMIRHGVGVPEESMLGSFKIFLLGGFQLPWLNTLSKMDLQYVPFLKQDAVSPILFFVLWGFLIYVVWRGRVRSRIFKKKTLSTLVTNKHLHRTYKSDEKRA